MARRLEVLALVFPGLNILDLTGPSEVFGNSSLSAQERRITVAASHDTVTSSEGITVKRDLSFIELLAAKPDGSIELSRFDVLVMPGAFVKYIDEAIEDDHTLFTVLKAFAGLPPSEDGRQKWLFSICTGAGFFGHCGFFAGKTVTCHWRYLDTLREICKAAGGDEATVVRKRFVDAGKTASGVRIITAGGVSCGIDAALWIASQEFDKEKALTVASAMDYDWKFGGNEYTEGYIV